MQLGFVGGVVMGIVGDVDGAVPGELLGRRTVLRTFQVFNFKKEQLMCRRDTLGGCVGVFGSQVVEKSSSDRPKMTSLTVTSAYRFSVPRGLHTEHPSTIASQRQLVMRVSSSVE